jgi:tetratricopeptide (TPR) repeat protein
MTFRLAAFRALLLASAASFPLVAGAQTAGNQSGTSDVIRVLLDQSAYWRSKSETKLADEALVRVLALDPNNVDALAAQAQAAADRGDQKAAQDALAKLKAARPDDPRIASIQQSLLIGPIDQASLAQARALAQEGKPADSLAAYRRVFKGDSPPPSLATEFYQTLGATEGNWEAARDGLAAHLRLNPQDLQAQLAYAELLTYRDGSRDDGIQRLAFLTHEPQVADAADKAWRQTLSWLPATQASVAKYQDYLVHNPNDTDVQHLLNVAQGDSGSLRAGGFDDLSNNKLAQADAAFTKAVAVDDKDSDSLIGLALVRFKQNRQTEGRDLIRRAIEIDPSKATQYQSMLDTSAAGQGGYRGNGNGTGIDYGAQAVRKIRGEYARVAALTQRGEYAAAEALLHQLMGKRPNAGNYLQLGDIQARAGKLAEAEGSFRTVLRSQPRNVAALGGLGNVLSREGKTDDATQVLSQAQALGGGNATGQNRAQALSKQAEGVSDPAARTGLFRAAVAADPANPWLRLELARSLLGQDREAEARQIMASVTDGPRPSVDQLRAGIYFADSDHENSLAASLVNRLPASARTPEMQEVGVRSEIAADVQDAKSQPTPAAMEQRMVALAAKPDPTGGRAAAFAQALTRAGNKAGAREVIRAALAATRSPTPQQRIAYAAALVGAGYPRDANVVTAGLQSGGLNPLQRSNLQSVQDDAAVSAADSLNADGNTTEAMSQLRPRLQQDPANPALNMALARVYQAQKQPGTAVAITQELLKRNPNDVSVQVAAVSAALSAGDMARAGQLSRQLTTDFPEDPQGWFAAAQVARSRGDNGTALSYLRKARDLRKQQLANESSSDASDVMVPGWLPGRQYALNQPANVMNDASPDPAPATSTPVAGNGEPVTREYERYAQNTATTTGTGAPQGYVPFSATPLAQPLSVPPGVDVRAGVAPLASAEAMPAQTTQNSITAQNDLGVLSLNPTASPSRSTSSPTPNEPGAGPNATGLRGSTQQLPADPLTADIDRSIQQVSASIAPEVDGSLSLRGRSGSRGLSKLFDVEAPLEASFSPNGYGRLKVQVTPVYLYTGQPAGSTRSLFGSNPITAVQTATGGTPFYARSPTTDAAGAALDVSYAYDFVTADIGATPIGFQQSQIVGGVQFLPRLTNNLYLRLTADRRAVTDSVLSYAGQTDGRTGEKFGGVTKNRLYANFEGSVGSTYYYAGAGFSELLGEQVASNTVVEAGAGFSTPVWTTPTQEVRLGANAVYFGFRQNLGNFTIGNGGYFSPQQYFAFLIPATYKQQVTDNLVYNVGASLGVQTFRAKSSRVFPTDDALQTILASSTSGAFGTRFSGFKGTGLAGGGHADIDYRVNNNLHIGAQAGVDRSGTFTEGTGLVYARYTFNNPPQ